MSAQLEAAFQQKILAKDLAPTFDLKIEPAGANLDVPDVVGFDVQEAEGQRAATAVITIANPIVSDGGETAGKYAPDRDFGTYAAALKLGRQIRLKGGYGTGSDLVSIFTGLIDDVKMGRPFDGVPTLRIEARDMMVRFLKQKIRDQAETFPAGMKGNRTDSPEGHFTQYATWAGFAAGDIVTDSSLMTGLRVDWDNEWYESKIAVLEKTCGFSAWADTDGKAHFQQIPESTAGVVVYEEGGDTSRVGRLHRLDNYGLSWRDLHKYLIVVARDSSGNKLQSIYEFTSTTVADMLPDDILVFHLPGVQTTQAGLDAAAARLGRRMAAGLRTVEFTGPAIPHHVIGDVVQLIESSSTASEFYRINGRRLSWQKRQPFMQTLRLNHYGAAA